MKCDSVYKTEKSVNIHLTVQQALELSRNLLAKAQQILGEGRANVVGVQVYNAGKSHSLSFGIITSHKGRRRKK